MLEAALLEAMHTGDWSEYERLNRETSRQLLAGQLLACIFPQRQRESGNGRRLQERQQTRRSPCPKEEPGPGLGSTCQRLGP